MHYKLQVVAYSAWSTNKTKWSYASGLGKFRVPDRTNIHERNSSATLIAGNYLAPAIGPHKHLMFGENAPGNITIDALSGVSKGYSDGGNLGYRLSKSTGVANAGLSGNIGENIAAENFVNSYFINRFVKI